MAKQKKTTSSKARSEPTYEGMTLEDLRRALGFDELTREACFEGLFGDLLDKPKTGTPGGSGGSVTQMGPGRRHRSRTDE